MLNSDSDASINDIDHNNNNNDSNSTRDNYNTSEYALSVTVALITFTAQSFSRRQYYECFSLCFMVERVNLGDSIHGDGLPCVESPRLTLLFYHEYRPKYLQ